MDEQRLSNDDQFEQLVESLEVYGNRSGTEEQLDQTTEMLRLLWSFVSDDEASQFLKAANEDMKEALRHG